MFVRMPLRRYSRCNPVGGRRLTLMANLGMDWNRFRLAKSTSPLSVTDTFRKDLVKSTSPLSVTDTFRKDLIKTDRYAAKG